MWLTRPQTHGGKTPGDAGISLNNREQGVIRVETVANTLETVGDEERRADQQPAKDVMYRSYVF